MEAERPHAPSTHSPSQDLPRDQRDYWTRVAPQKTFSHPLPTEWLAQRLPAKARILDCGCGYGRLTGELYAGGHSNVVGIDTSEGMIERARAERPGPSYQVWEGAALPFESESMDAALLFAVLTCIPDLEEQRRLVAELLRVLVPGGLLVVSDLMLQPDARNQDRYRTGEERFRQRGVFALPEGVVLTHLEEPWLDTLLSPFGPLEQRSVELHTMNGNPAVAEQRLVRKPRRAQR